MIQTVYFPENAARMVDYSDINELEFCSSFLLRTPIFPFNHKDRNIEESLKDPLFRYAIGVGSTDLYRELEKADFNYNRLSANCKASLWKYSNRMHFRPTPFGLFAAFSVVSWFKGSTPILTSDKLIFHLRNDFKANQELMGVIITKETLSEHSYIANPTLYPVQHTYRYLSQQIKNNQTGRSFHIDEIEKTDILEKIIHRCEFTTPFKDIITVLCADFQFPDDHALQYVSDLINLGVLVPELDLQVNISGEDYLDRNDIGRIKIDEIEEIKNYSAIKLYVNTERLLTNNKLSDVYQNKIRDGLFCLKQLSITQAHPLMDKFVRAFTAKYDRQQIPLLQALDPSIGIGYNVISPGKDKPSLLQTAPIEIFITSSDENQWTPVHTLLMQKWLINADKYSPIYLAEKDIRSLTTQEGVLPNSFSIMFRVTKQGLVIEQAGGASGTSLSGRFTSMNKTVYHSMNVLASNEERANPDVLFAEICHIEDFHTANIDRRENLYSYEIPILCGSVNHPDYIISLSDLFVSVLDNQVYLWSKKHNKRVIPRLSSAYNYSRSELSVFRFLCDLQHEGLQSALCFDLQHLFPEQDFYPRIYYKDVILQLATWVINEEYATSVVALPLAEKITSLREFREQNKCPRYLSLDEFDHQLVFDLENPDDLYQLSIQIKPCTKFLLREFLSPDQNTPIVTTGDGKDYINQFLATMYHNHTIYPKFQPDMQTTGMQRIFVPGSEWLYYKLYVHPAVSNEVLIKHVLKCIAQLRLQGFTKKWFFVRYKDPDYHLRIRLQLTPKHTGYAMNRFSKTLEHLVASGIIQGYSIDSYERELERYSPELIDVCEEFFCQSTALITGWLDKITANDQDYDYYYIAVSSTRIMAAAFAFSDPEIVSLFRKLYEGMAAQMVSDRKSHNKAMKQRHRDISLALSGLDQWWHRASQLLKKPLKLFEGSITKIALLSKDWPDDKRKQLFADLVHMQLNRLLVDDIQRQELIFYYHFLRLTESEVARKKL